MPVSCSVVRDQLAEYAVGVLPPRERRAVERHLEWCAACRKEAEELTGAAATLAFALDPAPVPEPLLDRVRGAISRVVRPSSLRRGTRSAAMIAIAALVAISALGWGAVMAGRAQRFEDRARVEAASRTSELRRFRMLFRDLQSEIGTELQTDDARLAQLAPIGSGLGGGAAMELLSQHYLDFVMVHVSGLSRQASSAPYTVWLLDGTGNAVRAGRLTALDQDGGGDVFHQFNFDLTPYTTVLLRDANGQVALRGVVDRP
ncbi:MAG: zf-HC2 domain-containing protein [Actinomycetota bacterium]